MKKIDWPEREPTRADRLFGWIVGTIILAGSFYFIFTAIAKNACGA